MMKEQDTLFLMALVGVGAVIMSGFAVFKQWIVVVPLFIVVMFFAFMLFYQNRSKFIHISEKLENYAFILALIFFIVGFILLYRPA